MQIDWFTVIAQVINFIILLVILKFVLFDRIVQAIDERKQRIATAEHEAEEARKDAEKEHKKAEQERKKMEAEKEQCMEEARNAAENHRHQLEKEAEHDAEKMRNRFHKNLQEEQEKLVAEIIKTAALGVGQATQKIFADLADIHIHERMVGIFLDELRSLQDREREQLAEDWHDLKEPLLVQSPRELSQEEQNKLAKTLEVFLGSAPKLHYEISPDLGGGIEITGAGRALRWSAKSYLENLQEQLIEMLQQDESRESQSNDSPEQAPKQPQSVKNQQDKQSTKNGKKPSEQQEENVHATTES